MKVLFITIGDMNVPSSRVRALQYIPNFEKEGVACSHLQFRKGSYLKFKSYGNAKNLFQAIMGKILTVFLKAFDYLVYSKIRIIQIWWSFRKYDLVFIQKVVLPSFLVRRMKSSCKIVFDFDDAIYTQSRLFTLKQFRSQICKSDITIVTNEEARDYALKAGGKHVEMIVGPVDSERYHGSGSLTKSEKLNIGWIGSQSTAQYLELIQEPLRIISNKYPGKICLHLVGVDHFHMDGVETSIYQWDPGTEVQLLDMFDVGVMPLKNDEFSRGKGAYKLLQYMSMGKANISSPVGVNQKLVEHGKTGLLADSVDEWLDCMELYLHDISKRAEHGANARALIEKAYSLQRWSKYLLKHLNI